MKNNTHTIQAISTYFHPVTAGAELNLMETCSRLVSKGWQVLVHTTTNTPTEVNTLPAQENIRGIDVRRHRYFTYALLPFFLRIKNVPGIVWMDDFITFPDVFVCLYTLFLKFFGLKKYKLILAEHGLFGVSTSVYPTVYFRLKQFVDHSLGVFLMNHAVDGIRAVSEWERNILIKAGVREDLIVVIKNGIEPEAFMPDLLDKVDADFKKQVDAYGSYVLRMARIDKIKNYPTSIRAMAHVPKHIKLVIAGPKNNTAYYYKLLELVTELQLTDRVIFVGVVSGANKYYLMRKAIAFVHPTEAEGFGIVVVEAQSQGCVCVVSKDSPLTELVQEGVNGYTIRWDDVDALAEKVNYIIANKDSAQMLAMQAANREFAKTFTWDGVTTELENWYSGLLNNKPNHE